MRKKVLPSAGLVLVSAFLAAFPGYSFGEVQVNLKNETSIIADECREETDRLVCFMMGGTFEIEKRDVLSMKNISVRRSPVPDTSAPEAAAPGKSDSSSKAGDRAEGTLPAGKAPGPANPANHTDPLAQKRLSLQAERESLLKERQQIQDDINNARIRISGNQFDELNRRSAELDAKIKRFNEETSRLSGQGKQSGSDVKK
jgi:hypothetical protein